MTIIRYYIRMQNKYYAKQLLVMRERERRSFGERKKNLKTQE